MRWILASIWAERGAAIEKGKGKRAQARIPPFVPGVSAVGRVIEVGPNVEGLQIGDRVAHTNAGFLDELAK